MSFLLARRWWILALVAIGLVLRYAFSTSGPKAAEATSPLPDYATERATKDSLWRVAVDSPLPDSLRARFNGLAYFPAGAAWRVEARYTALSTLTPLLVPFHNAEAPEPYVRVGKLAFTLNGRACTLTALRRPTEPADAPLFIPFTDATNGQTTYEGGRYLNLPAPSVGETRVTLDFNRTYAPTCAHVPDFRCPVPPAENRLPVAVEAGERSRK